MLYVFFWGILYGCTYIISQIISQVLHIAKWFVPLAMLLYVCLFMFWIYATGRSHAIGLCVTKSSRRRGYFDMLPLFLLPIFNVIMGKEFRVAFPTIIYVISVSITEELFFRGFLLRYFLKRSKLYGIIISSVMFAVFHFVNIVQCNDFTYIFMQVLCAFVVGICYSAIVVRYNSLLPCLIAHSFTNITGINTLSINVSNENIFGIWICIAIYAGYAILLCRKID